MALLAAIALAAFLVRLIGVLIGGGLNGVLGYDDMVYFADTLAFVGGRIPYRDFHILHPPGILYLLSPFAIVGRFTDDATAFALARLSTNDHSPTPIGIFRQVERPEYADAMARQVMAASEKKGPGDLAALLRSNGTWLVG